MLASRNLTTVEKRKERLTKEKQRTKQVWASAVDFRGACAHLGVELLEAKAPARLRHAEDVWALKKSLKRTLEERITKSLEESRKTTLRRRYVFLSASPFSTDTEREEVCSYEASCQYFLRCAVRYAA